MAPRKKQPRRARGGAAQHLSPLEALPPELLAAVGRRLVTQDKLNNILTAARDIASLAQASKCVVLSPRFQKCSLGWEEHRRMHAPCACAAAAGCALWWPRTRGAPRRTMAAFAEGTLWGLLGQQYTAEGSSGAALSAVPKAEQYEQQHMVTKVRKLVPVPKPKALTQKYQEVGRVGRGGGVGWGARGCRGGFAT